MLRWMPGNLGIGKGPVAKLVGRLGGGWSLLIAFVLIDIALQWLGHHLQERPGTPTVLWPASGLVFAVFWLGGRSRWPLLGSLHILIETFSFLGTDGWLPPLLISLTDVLECALAATLVTLWVKEPTRIRVNQIALFVLAAGVSTGVGAMLGSFVETSLRYPHMGYWPQMQLWWVGNWLGIVTVAPVLYFWARALSRRTPEVDVESRVELFAYLLFLPLISWYVFTAPAGQAGSIIQLPVMAFGLLTLATFRIPPRWAVTLAAMFVLLVALLAVHEVGLFAVEESFERMIYLQTFLATAAISTSLLSIAITEMRLKTQRLAESEYRYRSFVEMSSEAVWCIELVKPMPITLPADKMREWFFAHAHITECSLTFSRLDPEDSPDQAKPLRSDSMWVGIYQRYLEEIALRKFSSSEFRVVVPFEGKTRVMLACFDGVVKHDELIRIWGLARDVTELTDLNSRLQRERDRLRNYAQALTTAEERARRATAVDLHDGICQSLVGMSMKIEAAKHQVPAAVNPLLDEIKQQLHDVQEQTRDVISGLSPPGLYDLGLAPALNWLAVYYRSHEKLNVKVDCLINEAHIGQDLRILVFKLVRELLRNVSKHAKVDTARLVVKDQSERLVVRVEDDGCGFHWNPDSNPTGQFRFGLWSISERVAEMGGVLRVDSSLGKGARLELIFPLVLVK